MVDAARVAGSFRDCSMATAALLGKARRGEPLRGRGAIDVNAGAAPSHASRMGRMWAAPRDSGHEVASAWTVAPPVRRAQPAPCYLSARRSTEIGGMWGRMRATAADSTASLISQ